MSEQVVIDRLRRAMDEQVEGIEPRAETLERALSSPPRRRLSLGWLVPALAVAVAAVVAVVAITSLGHRAPGPAPAGAAAPVAARRLVSRLAVLRRAQRPSDVLSGSTSREIESLTYRAQLVTGLSRLVGSLNLGHYGRARVYVVVQKPPHFPIHVHGLKPPLLSPRLGDQASIAFVGPFRIEAAINHPSVAAGGDDLAATSSGVTAAPNVYTSLWGAVASIVPDRVIRVKWVFADAYSAGGQAITVWPRVRSNVAIGRIPPRLQVYLRYAVWYGAGGRVLATVGSPAPSPATSPGFKAALEASLGQRVDPALLRHFGLLRTTHPSRSGLDQAVAAGLIEPNPLGLNLGKERLAARAQLLVIPGSQGIAIRPIGANVQPAEDGTGGALAGDLLIVGPRRSGHRTVLGLAPDGNRVVTVLLPGGGRRTAPVIDNVYSLVVPANARTLLIRNAAGRLVRLHLVL